MSMLPMASSLRSIKLNCHSLPCIFVDYSSTQSAYYCLDPATHRVYISRHVRFVENEFPYTRLTSTTTVTEYLNPDAWCSISLPLPIFNHINSLPDPSIDPLTISPQHGSPTFLLNEYTNQPLTPPTTISSTTPLHTSSQSTIESQDYQQPPPQPPSIITTRSKNNIYKPNPKYANITTTKSNQSSPLLLPRH